MQLRQNRHPWQPPYSWGISGSTSYRMPPKPRSSPSHCSSLGYTCPCLPVLRQVAVVPSLNTTGSASAWKYKQGPKTHVPCSRPRTEETASSKGCQFRPSFSTLHHRKSSRHAYSASSSDSSRLLPYR